MPETAFIIPCTRPVEFAEGKKSIISPRGISDDTLFIGFNLMAEEGFILECFDIIIDDLRCVFFKLTGFEMFVIGRRTNRGTFEHKDMI